MIKKILLAALVVAFLILKFYDARELKFSTIAKIPTVAEIRVDSLDSFEPVTIEMTNTVKYSDTLWLSHLSAVSLIKAPKYSNWQSPKILSDGEVGFDFKDLHRVKKLIQHKNGEISVSDIYFKVEKPRELTFLKTISRGEFTYHAVGLYKNEKGFIALYREAKNHSIVEATIVGDFEKVAQIEIYTKGAHNVFGNPGDERVFLSTTRNFAKQLEKYKEKRQLNG